MLIWPCAGRRVMVEVVVQLPAGADGGARERVILNPSIAADEGVDATPQYMAFKFSEMDTLLGDAGGIGRPLPAP